MWLIKSVTDPEIWPREVGSDDLQNLRRRAAAIFLTSFNRVKGAPGLPLESTTKNGHPWAYYSSEYGLTDENISDIISTNVDMHSQMCEYVKCMSFGVIKWQWRIQDFPLRGTPTSDVGAFW